MKYILWIVLIAASYNSCLVAMNGQKQEIINTSSNANELDQYELAAWMWMTKLEKALPQETMQDLVLKNLAPEDYEVIYHQGITYQKGYESTVQPMERYIEAFYGMMQAVTDDLPPLELLKSAWQKTIINLFSIHADNTNKETFLAPERYVFCQLLTKEEQDRFRKNNYRKHPRSTATVVRKHSELVVAEYVKLGRVENTDAAKSAQIKELYEDRMAHAKK